MPTLPREVPKLSIPFCSFSFHFDLIHRLFLSTSTKEN